MQCPLRSYLRNRFNLEIGYMEKLMQGGVSLNTRCPAGNTPVLEAVYTKPTAVSIQFIQMGKKYGMDLNFFNDSGISPLLKAVMMGNAQLVEALVGVESLKVDMLNMFRLSALYYAVSGVNGGAIVRLLLKAGADPNIQVSPWWGC